ncbi:MAG: AsmA family protein, partial [Methyloceanibacter sp.]
MNSFLLSLTALLILVLSALFAAPLFIDWNDYRHVFETQASKLLGREVKVDGKVHLVLLPAPELKFNEVKVADEAGSFDRPILEARSIEAWLKIGSLLSGTVEAREIVIVDPVLRLDVKADGTGNWRDVGRPGVSLPFAPKEVMLDSVSVSGGRIEITKAGKDRLTLDDVEGELSAASLAGPYKVTAAYDYQDRRQELRFSTAEPDAAGAFRIKAVLRDGDRGASYVLDGAVSGLGDSPAYDGNFIMRIADEAVDTASPAMVDQVGEADGEQILPETKPAAEPSFVELKGPLKATPDQAELPEFDLTIHTHGRSQILKGNLALDLTEPFKARGALAARFVDLDLLFGAPGTEQRPSPATVLYMIAEEALIRTTEIGEGALTVGIEQANLGGDLVSGLDLALASSEGVMTIERLTATLPGDNRLEVSGQLTQGGIGPIFTGPVKLEGTGLRRLTRWAAGDHDISGQASAGDFSFQADATIGDGQLTLAEARGEVSDTTFRGMLRYLAGERNLIELSLDSDRLDLREMIGEGPIWRSWLPAAPREGTTEGSNQNFLAQLRDHDARITLNIGELLLPHIPGGKLDARFTLVDDILDVGRLDFSATDEIALTGKGRIESVGDAPSGRVDFTLKAATTDSLRVVSGLFGLPEDVSQSKHLSVLAPLDVQAALVAAREDEATKASLELNGRAGGSDIALSARASGDPDRLAEAEIDISGSVTGERPQALLVLLFPDLPQ